MTDWTFYPAFLGTVISIVAWTVFALKEHDSNNPKTLSELGAKDDHTLLYYRVVLWLCGPLFAITFLFFIVPRITNNEIVAFFCILTVVTELLLGVFPARGRTVMSHNIISWIMGSSMLVSTILFAWNLSGAVSTFLYFASITMAIFMTLAILNTKKFLFYELLFLYVAHISVLVTAIALK